MTQEHPSELLAFFKAMANESRLRIVGLLGQGERSVQELAELTDLTEPTVSHHLAMLKAIGLVEARAEGVTRWHRLRPEVLRDISRKVLETSAAPSTGVTSWDDKVLATFVSPEGALKAIPASRRKRWVVLGWLAEAFDEGRDYPESEINRVLQERHWDSATLRREMIGAAMMTREAGVYRRQPRETWKSYAEARPDRT
jgi:hypothetical protein